MAKSTQPLTQNERALLEFARNAMADLLLAEAKLQLAIDELSWKNSEKISPAVTRLLSDLQDSMHRPFADMVRELNHVLNSDDLTVWGTAPESASPPSGVTQFATRDEFVRATNDLVQRMAREARDKGTDNHG